MKKKEDSIGKGNIKIRKRNLLKGLKITLDKLVYRFKNKFCESDYNYNEQQRINMKMQGKTSKSQNMGEGNKEV